MDLGRLTGKLSDAVDQRATRRSFLARLSRFALVVSGAGLIEALEMTAPSQRAFANHCSGHAGVACANQSNCTYNRDACGRTLVQGGSWTACCTAQCAKCEVGRRYYTRFYDCCSLPCGGEYCGNAEGYCSTNYPCVRCTRSVCTTTVCGSVPICFAPAA
jgi:hypothetical protein